MLHSPFFINIDSCIMHFFCGRFFHVRRLRYEAGGRMTGSNLTTLSNQVRRESDFLFPNIKNCFESYSVRIYIFR